MSSRARVWSSLMLGVIVAALVVSARVRSRRATESAGSIEAGSIEAGSIDAGAAAPSLGVAELVSAEAPSASRASANSAGALAPGPSAKEATQPEHEGAIQGRIAVPAGHPREWIDLHVECESEERLAAHTFAWDADGSFRFARLRPGSYRLALNLWNGQPGSHSVGGIVVAAGRTTTLAPLDLAELVRTLRFDVRDERATPVLGATLALKAPGFDGPPLPVECEAGPDGALLLRTLELPVPLVLVAAPGFRAVELCDVRTDQRLVLEHGPRVLLVLDGGLPRLGDDWELLAQPVRDEVWEGSVAFDARGEATLALGRAGDFAVTLALRRTGQQETRSVDGLDWWITVEDSSLEQVFTSPAFTAAFLDALEKQRSR